jgi:hypothetical protein
MWSCLYWSHGLHNWRMHEGAWWQKFHQPGTPYTLALAKLLHYTSSYLWNHRNEIKHRRGLPVKPCLKGHPQIGSHNHTHLIRPITGQWVAAQTPLEDSCPQNIQSTLRLCLSYGTPFLTLIHSQCSLVLINKDYSIPLNQQQSLSNTAWWALGWVTPQEHQMLMVFDAVTGP